MNWRRISIFGLAFFILILCILLLIVLSSWGARLTLTLVEKVVPDLNIEYRSGALLHELSLNQIYLDRENIKVDLKNIDIKIKNSCLWAKTLCIEEIIAEEFTFTSISVNSDFNEEQPVVIETYLSQELFSIPIAIELPYLAVDNIQINIDSISVMAKNFNIGFEMKGSNVLLTKPEISLLQVSLPDSSNSENDKEDTPPLLPINDLPTISIPLNLTVSNLALERVEILLQDNTYILDEVALSANWKLSTLQIKEFELLYAEMGKISLQGSATFSELYPIDLAATIDVQQILQWPEINQSLLSGQVQGDISELAINLESIGTLQGQAQGSVQLNSVDLPFSFSLNALTLPLPGVYADQIQPSSLVLESAGTLTLQQVELEANISGFGYNNARLNGNLTHQQQRIDIANLEFLDEENQSEVSASGWLNYQQGLEWLGTLSLNNFLFPDFIFSQLNQQPLAGLFNGQFNTQGQWYEEAWQVRLFDTDISGQFNQMPAKLSGDFSLDSSWLMPSSDIHLELNDLVLDLQGYNDDDWHVTGTLQANSLQQWHEDLVGQGLLQLEVSGDLLNPVISIDGGIQQLFWQDYSVPSLSLSGQYQPGNNHSGNIDINAKNIQLGENNIEQLQIFFNGDFYEQNMQVLSSGALSSHLSLQGEWLQQEKRWLGNLQEANFNYNELEITLDNNIALDLQIANTVSNTGTKLTISAHCWQNQENYICLKQNADLGQSGHLEIELNAELSTLDELFLPPELTLDSLITGELSVDWNSVSTPLVNAQFAIKEGQLKLDANNEPVPIMSWEEGVLNLNIENAGAFIDFSLFQDQLNPLVDIDLQISDQYQQISGKVLLNEFSLQPLIAFVDEIRELEGKIDANIIFSGDLTKPDLAGNISINQGTIGLISTPQTLDSIDLLLILEDQTANIEGKLFVEEKQATITGKAAWQDQFSLDVDFNTEPLDIIFPPQLFASVQSHLSLALRPERLMLSGQVNILSGLLTLESLPEGRVNPSQDQVFLSEEIDQATQKLFEIETDIQVVINEDFEIEGFGFTGNLGGELSLEQVSDQLQVFGALQIPQGRYRAYGQRLDVTQGEISFSGSAENPAIDFSAVREISDENVEVGILVQGLANNLTLSFFSEPAMEESELMSYLIRGRALGSEGGGNSAIAVALGSSLMKRTGLLEELEEASLLNNIVIDTAGQGSNTQATIGGYIGERIYLKYGVGVYEPINELTVRLYLLNRLWLETVNGLESSSGDLYYSFEID